ncbi:hypothetical protein BGZ57DRAFT_929261 [Hyaloscypha finlandica]|nr:hypothetical protein BGZ57DRAFT_929261 [Hyaloscypha finlandica]
MKTGLDPPRPSKRKLSSVFGKSSTSCGELRGAEPDEGLGDPLLPGKLSAASLDPNGLSTSQSICQISPNSIPITWDGRAKDLKQAAMKGKKYGALVKLRKLVKERNEDQATMKFHRDIIESLETVMEEIDCGKLFNKIPEAPMELEYTKSKVRAEILQTEIERIGEDLFSQHLKLNHNIRTVFKLNDIRELDDHPRMKGLGESKRAKYDMCMFEPTLSSESEDFDSEYVARRPNRQ